MAFPTFRQLESIDCGPTCIRIIAKYYGKNISLKHLKELCRVTKIGSTVQDIVHGCEAIELKAVPVQISIKELKRMPLPAILYWNQQHYVVLYKIKKTKKEYIFYISDPDFGKIKLAQSFIEANFLGSNDFGISILVEPTVNFKNIEEDSTRFSEEIKRFLSFFQSSLKHHRKKFILSFILALLAMGANWVLPVLFQKVIDDGIGQKDFNLVTILILSQLIIFIGYIISNGLSNLILSKTGVDVGLSLLTEYLNKLIKLPIRFFDGKLSGDLIQRMEDLDFLKRFLTFGAVKSIFSALNLIVFSSLLIYYDIRIFYVFLCFSVISIAWVYYFIGKRKILNYRLFSILSEGKNSVYELITGMKEIKLNNAHKQRIKQWGKIQKRANDNNISQVKVSYYTTIGVDIISKLKDIIVVGLCANLVIDNQMTLGAMMTISYVLAQASAPLTQIAELSKEIQDAKLSYDRVSEIHEAKEEVRDRSQMLSPELSKGINLNNVSFKYPGSFSPYVLKNISLSIPLGKRIAIVGASGSGKTTLLKLLLAFYKPQKGDLLIDGINMGILNPDKWRDNCAVVMQDGVIFSGTIADNIALNDETPCPNRLKDAMKAACFEEFVNELPMKQNTAIGNSGIEMSGGQKQRLLIARAVYRNSSFLFLDEATNSLDATNENKIVENLDSVTQGKTVVIVAHRLSTVKNADQIIVLDKGELVEKGTHEELTILRGKYYHLVKNQLELGN